MSTEVQRTNKFDPSKHLQKLQGQEYLPVKWRLVWLRSEYPEARITTTLHTLDTEQGKEVAVFRAEIELPNGAKATGYGSEQRTDFRDFVEKAETKAVGRALGLLGFGTQFSIELEDPHTTERKAPAQGTRQAPAHGATAPAVQKAGVPSISKEVKEQAIREWAKLHKDNEAKVTGYLAEQHAQLLANLPVDKLDELMGRYHIKVA